MLRSRALVSPRAPGSEDALCRANQYSDPFAIVCNNWLIPLFDKRLVISDTETPEATGD